MKGGHSEQPRLRGPCVERPECRKKKECHNRPICERGPPQLPESICEDKFQPERNRDDLYDKYPEDAIVREKSRIVTKVKDAIEDAKEKLEDKKADMKKMKYVCECGVWRPFDNFYYRNHHLFNFLKCSIPFVYLVGVLVNIIVFLSLF